MIIAEFDLKLNKSANFYHTIQVFIKMNKGEAEPNNA